MIALAAAVSGSGCSSEDAGAPAESENTPPAVSRPTDAAAEANRAACEFQAGALPQDTLGESDRIGSDIPIDHIIVIMMENRSFDHYFSKLPEYGQPDVAVAGATDANEDATGESLERFHDELYCVHDPSHGWNAAWRQYNEGKMDGFVVSSSGAAATAAMGYLDDTDLPFYYDLANTVAISDHYFASILAPTWPNRQYLFGASSHGLTSNKFPEDAANIFTTLSENNIDYMVYRSNLATPTMYGAAWFDEIAGCNMDEGPCHVAFVDDAMTAIREGTLPPVSLIEPEFTTDFMRTSEHPPGNVQVGQHFVWEVVDAVTKSPKWASTALFITYDENGGFYDHMPPPTACAPGDQGPKDEEHAAIGEFDRLGFRVPLMVVSPYAKKHFVSHEVYDHTSILRFIQARHGLPAFTARDANAGAMMDLFDFDSPPFETAPSFAEPIVDQQKLDQCELDFAGE
jgi:phospholipase C